MREGGGESQGNARRGDEGGQVRGGEEGEERRWHAANRGTWRGGKVGRQPEGEAHWCCARKG